MTDKDKKERIAFFGGSFDPVHIGHTEIARSLKAQFDLDVFLFVPAYHAPHKREIEPASAFHRFAMLALATDGVDDIGISTIELEDPESPYTIETIEKVESNFPGCDIFFVIGADSWQEITTWRRWEEVLTGTSIIVVTRPGFKIGFSHVTDEIRERIVDLRGQETGDRRQETGKTEDSEPGAQATGKTADSEPGEEATGVTVKSEPGEEAARITVYGDSIFITDAVNVDISATELRQAIREGEPGWEQKVPGGVARHISKYGLYK